MTDTITQKVERTSTGLRDALFDELDALRCGESTPLRANAVARIATGIVETVRLEVEVQKYISTLTSHASDAVVGSPIGTPLPLGKQSK